MQASEPAEGRSNMKIQSTLAVALALMATTGTQAQQFPQWQLNAPYLCPNGDSYTITRRVGSGYGETCVYTQRHDGRFVTNAYSLCRQMTGRLRGCIVGSPRRAAPAQTASEPLNTESLDDTRYRCPGGLVMSIYQCGKLGGQGMCYVRLEMNGQLITGLPKPVSAITKLLRSCQTLPPPNPAYLMEFPSAYRVVKGMVVGNPLDNVQRAIGALYQLSVIVQTLGGGRTLTVDEEKLLEDYGKAQAALEGAAAKKFPTRRFDLAANPFHYPRSDPRFGFEGIPVWTAFLSSDLQSRFAQIVGGGDVRYMSAIGQQRQAAIQQVQAAARVMASQANSPHDAGTLAVRRCMESGRSDMECLGEGLKVGVADLYGGNPLKGIVPPTPVGLRLTGAYAAGNLQIVFSQTNATVRCGTLEPQPLSYSIERRGQQLLIDLQVSPRPFTLAYQADGRLLGPGAVDITGLVPIGPPVDHPTGGEKEYVYGNHSYDAYDRNSGKRLHYDMGGAYIRGDVIHHYVTPTAPKTERCSAGALAPTGATLRASDALTMLFGTHASQSQNTASGLRLNGTYASPGGLKIEFRGVSATLDCGAAHHSEGYAVRAEGGALVARFQNATGPLALTVETDGTLAGSGSVQVDGRLISGEGADGRPLYAPVSARCAIGTLTAAR
jgi:hypothetical protein